MNRKNLSRGASIVSWLEHIKRKQMYSTSVQKVVGPKNYNPGQSIIGHLRKLREKILFIKLVVIKDYDSAFDAV